MAAEAPPRPSPEEVAARTDELLRTLAREEVLVSRLVGRALVRLAALDGFAALGYSTLASYAGQQLGISGHAAQELAWMERRVERYPAVDAAYEAGRLTFSHARLLLRNVKPEDELLWAEVAPRLSVAELEQAIEDWKQRGLAPAAPDETAGTVPLHGPEDMPKAHRIRYFATPAQTVKLDLAVELVRRDHGADLHLGACLEFMMAEFLNGAGFSAHATAGNDDDDDDVPGEMLPWRVPRIGKLQRKWREIELGLAEFSEHWEALCWAVPPVPAPAGVTSAARPEDVDRHLSAVARRYRKREVHLMALLAIIRDNTLYEFLDFSSLEHYVADRLMFSPRAAWTLLAVERRTRAFPSLRQAYEGGVLSKAQILLVADVIRDDTEAAWIEHARNTTLKFLREDVKAATRLRVLDPEGFAHTGGLPEGPRLADAERQRLQACASGPASGAEVPARAPVADDVDVVEWGRLQACASGSADEDRGLRAADVARLPAGERLRMYRRGDFVDIEEGRPTEHTFYLPHLLVEMWRSVVRACRLTFGRFVTIADCIEACVEAYLQTHGRDAMEAIRRHRVLERDGWLCGNPTCPRRANLEEHHLQFRSHGGSDEPFNRVALCATCHRRLLHQGRIRARGKAPDEISWELGVTAGGDPHLAVVGRRIVGGKAVLEERVA